MRLRLISLVFFSLATACDDGGGSADPTTAPTTSVSETDTSTPNDVVTPDDLPPVLAKIGDRSVKVGSALGITLSAHDPEGAAVSYFVAGSVPADAMFDRGGGTFSWTPRQAGSTVIIFGASDGTLEDREAVTITATEADVAHRPELVDPGTQYLTTGVRFELTIEGTDADGDALSFEALDLPSGADFRASTFTWTPDAEGEHQVTFVVSDGSQTDSAVVTFIVDGAANARPIFYEPATVRVREGTTATVPLQASDPDGDALTFALRAEVTGVELSGATLVFTPASAQIGSIVTVPISVSDGSASVDGEVSFQVDPAPACAADAWEPNDSVAAARALEMDTVIDATLCDASGDDVDLYTFDLPAGASFDAVITIEQNAGVYQDLDLAVLDASGNVLAHGDRTDDVDWIVYGSDSAATVYLRVARPSAGVMQQSYQLVAELWPDQQCTSDASEPNDSLGTAKPLPSSASICLGASDWYELPTVTCGQTVTLTIAATPASDFEGGAAIYAADGRMLDFIRAFTGEPEESDALPAGTHRVEIAGYYSETSLGADYTIGVGTQGGCQDDGKHNDAAARAFLLEGESGTLAEEIMCCVADWYALDLQAGSKATLAVDALGAYVAVVAPGTSTALAVSTDTFSPEVTFTANVDGRYLVKVGYPASIEARAYDGESFELTWSVSAPSGCTYFTCGATELCDADTHTCVSAACGNDDDCPGSDWTCQDDLCVIEMDNPSLCRSRAGFDIKSSGPLSYCMPTGEAARFEPCQTAFDCKGEYTCAPELRVGKPSGYCSTDWCSTEVFSGGSLHAANPCDTGSVCVLASAIGGNYDFCAESCSSPTQCATGYACVGGACR